MDRRRFLHMSIAALTAACSPGPSGLDSVVDKSVVERSCGEKDSIVCVGSSIGIHVVVC